jgi:hypothetical protein
LREIHVELGELRLSGDAVAKRCRGLLEAPLRVK